MILEYKNVLSSELCKNIIDRFESDERKMPGMVIYENETERTIHTNNDVKVTTDIPFSKLYDWNDIKYDIFAHMPTYIEKYIEEINKKQLIPKKILYPYFHNIETPWANIQRTDKNGYFNWHSDYIDSEKRVLAFIFYLNTLDDSEGGETEFYNGVKIKPEEGKLILFPSDVIHFHRGCRVKTDKSKYIIAGFICK
jgi:hypothetical protein